MYDFHNKYICLVLTCNKIAYNERRNSNMHIYSKLKDAGFEIIFLYANSANSSVHIVKDENGYYNLTVPTEEAYINLPLKMWMAYSFLSTQYIKGVLKIDDDVYHIDDYILDLDFYDVDYMGMPAGDDFFYGPFYWLSNKAVQYIAESDIHPKSFKEEDVFVGKCLKSKISIKWRKTKWHESGFIKYTEPCVRYNPSMSTQKYCSTCVLCRDANAKNLHT